MTKASLPEVVAKFYSLLEPLDQNERVKVVQSTFALLGDTNPASIEKKVASSPITANVSTQAVTAAEEDLGQRASRWLSQNGLTMEMLSEVFHFSEDGTVELIAADVPGNSDRAKTISCYLLSGVRALLENDDSKFYDREATELCRQYHCYSAGNNANTRGTIGLAGSKGSGFSLPNPRLRDAASLVKDMVALTN